MAERTKVTISFDLEIKGNHPNVAFQTFFKEKSRIVKADNFRYENIKVTKTAAKPSESLKALNETKRFIAAMLEGQSILKYCKMKGVSNKHQGNVEIIIFPKKCDCTYIYSQVITFEIKKDYIICREFGRVNYNSDVVKIELTSPDSVVKIIEITNNCWKKYIHDEKYRSYLKTSGYPMDTNGRPKYYVNGDPIGTPSAH